MPMTEIELQDYARQLLEAHGANAVVEAAQKASVFEQQGQPQNMMAQSYIANLWIEDRVRSVEQDAFFQGKVHLRQRTARDDLIAIARTLGVDAFLREGSFNRLAHLFAQFCQPGIDFIFSINKVCDHGTGREKRSRVSRVGPSRKLDAGAFGTAHQVQDLCPTGNSSDWHSTAHRLAKSR